VAIPDGQRFLGWSKVLLTGVIPIQFLRRCSQDKWAVWGAVAEVKLIDAGRAITCVMVPLCTENRLHFSALLHDGAPQVSFERAVHG